MNTAAAYDRIGLTYSQARRADPRVAAQVLDALGDARRVVNVGAGTGSYEPAGRSVVAIDPSPVMLAQRAPGAAPAVRAVAERLPFPAGSFDAALAVLTVHHWRDQAVGLAELRRVAARQVIFFFEPALADAFWLVVEYFPQVLELSTERAAPGGEFLARHLDVQSLEPVLVPADCVDGFGGCYWNRPEAYLDPRVQAGISSFAQLAPAVRRVGSDRLRVDLESGAWDRRHGHLRELREVDLGYRILIAGS